MIEFKPFPKIERIGNLKMTITQKIHGTNAQVYIEKIDRYCSCKFPFSTNGKYCVKCRGNERSVYIHIEDAGYYGVYAASRTRWLTPEDDNYGFAKWVQENSLTLIELLGEGRHYGEWAGPGINSGEGLAQKTFIPFDYWKYPKDRPLPEDIKPVPVLYCGKIDFGHIEAVMNDLKNNGSKLTPGYMTPEGIVIDINGQKFKKTFEQEDVAWIRKKERVVREHVDYSFLCQPLRLEKLLSRDEKYLREYPKSLPDIAKAYIQDLEDEAIITGDEDGLKEIRKRISRQIFGFIKEQIEK